MYRVTPDNLTAESRAAWLAQRKTLVTASDVAALLGESPFKARDQLRMEKLGLADEFAGSESTDIAIELEPFVLRMARQRYGWDCMPNGLVIHLDEQCPRLGATPDAFLDSPWGVAIVQAKITSCKPPDQVNATRKDGAPSQARWALGPPLYYQLQVQAEMACTGAQHGVLLVLHTSPLALRSYYVPRHEGVIARIRAEVTRFWAELEGGMAA